MGQVALNHFVKSFRDQGFTDENFEPWKRRKKKDSRRGRVRQGSATYSQEVYSPDGSLLRRTEKVTLNSLVASVKNRATLVKTGALRRSLRKTNIGKYRVRITSNLPYSRVHNEGLRAGRGGGFTMRKRQFAGKSAIMDRKIKAKLHTRIRTIIKK